MSLLTLAILKEFLGVPSTVTSKDARLDRLRQAAEYVARNYTQQNLEEQAYVQFYSGTNTQRLVLRERPVSLITNVWLDNSGYFGKRPGGFDTTALLVEGTDYVLDYDQNATISKSGILFRIGTTWPVLTRVSTLGRLAPDQGPAHGNIKVSYTAGYAHGAVPADLQGAIAWIMAFLDRNLPVGGLLKSEHLGAYAYTIADVNKGRPELGSAYQVLSHYKDYPW